MIEIRKLNKLYDNGSLQVQAVKDVNLHIEKNDIYGIMGLSGAGKSTLIRLLNRLEEPSSGEIVVSGKNIVDFNKSELRNYRKKTGMIFQHFNLLESRDVKGNIAFSLEIAGWKKGDIKARVTELLALVGLEDKADFFPGQLSGGQKQRVAIARALANNPDILLSDEATSALDPRTTNSILNLLRDIQQKLGLTIILITHQMEVIRNICNRAAIMENGEVIEEGTTEEIFANPKTATAKEFVNHLVPEEEKEIELVKTPGKMIIKIKFLGQTAEQAIISKLVRTFDIDVNLLGGNIDKLVGANVGHLTVELDGDKDKQNQVVGWLESQNLIVEVKYNG